MTTLLEGLNPQQREAVQHVDGPLLIIAGPGSGKTRVLVHRIAYLVRDLEVRPWRIVAVTFTNKAAREMKERLERLMGPQARDLTMGTFHATCAMLLRREGDAIGLDRTFTIYDDEDQQDVIKQVMEELELDPKRFKPQAILATISNAKSQLLTAEEYRLRVQNYFEEVVSRVYQRYQELLDRANAVDFDDLLLKTYLLFHHHPDILERWQDRYLHVMVDEFQDTNVAQYAIARQLSGKHRNLCVVGDPDQSIYSWRNADIRNILSFQRDFPDAKTVTLQHNYRSTKTVLEAASAVIAANTQRIPQHLTTSNPQGSLITVTEAYNEEEEAQFILREVERLAKTQNQSYRDCAVMYRTNAQSRALEEACLRIGVPYKLVGGVKFYQRREVKDVLAYLRVLSNPGDEVSLARILNVPPRGIGTKTVDQLTFMARARGLSLYATLEGLDQANPADNIPWTPRSHKALMGFVHLLQGLRREAEHLQVADLVEAVVEQTGMRAHLKADRQEGEERLENVAELKAAAGEFNTLDSQEGLATLLERAALMSDVDKLDEEQQGITLITLHQAKGLEFPVVFIAGMEEGLLPHIRAIRDEDPAQMEEERRLCYVGMTRAKERLYLTRAFRRGFGGRGEPRIASRFLSDLPRQLIEGAAASAPPPAPRRRLDLAPLPEPANTPRQKPPLKAGDKVHHPRFGEGIVVRCVPARDDHEVTVAFGNGQGVKRLLLSYAPLTVVERSGR